MVTIKVELIPNIPVNIDLIAVTINELFLYV